MASNKPGKCCTIGVLHEGEASGKMIKIADKIDTYVATPPAGTATKGGIVYIADIWNLVINAKLMADQFAANGYVTLVPDLLNGDNLDPKKTDIMDFITKGTDGNNPHTPEFIDPIIVETIKAIKTYEGVGDKVASVGYCFGAKFLARNYKNGIKVGYMAHPSFVDEDELASISGPLSISACQHDPIFTTELRHKSEEILIKTGLPFQINLFSHVAHGFAVRGDHTKPIEKYAKEQAFYQAVAWFDEYLK